MVAQVATKGELCGRAEGGVRTDEDQPEEGQEADHQELVLHTLRGGWPAESLDDQDHKYPLARISKKIRISELCELNTESQD